MQANDFSKHSFHLHYSPSIDYSIGYRAEYWREKEWQFHGLQLNYLIKIKLLHKKKLIHSKSNRLNFV